MLVNSRAPSGTAPPLPLRVPAMIIIGAAGRNCGKTTLATELIRSVASTRRVIGAKVTTVHRERGPCPRGGEGCGVCSSLDGRFRLTEERGERQGKDTTRMLEAGAAPVYWLCAKSEHLREAADELVSRLAHDDVIVSESNSLRKVLEPDLFLITRRSGQRRIKRSCREVWELADEVVEFDGEHLLLPPGGFRLVDGRWTFRRQATAVVLAGGQSLRMGRDKALLPMAGRTMIEHIIAQLEPHFDQLLISANDPEKYALTGLEVVPDRVPHQGPMMAIASALERARHEQVFFVPCDVPRIPLPLLFRLLREVRAGADLAVPVTDEGRFEPLVAVYSRRALAPIDEALASGERQVFAVYDKCRTARVPLGDVALFNLNTLDDYRQIVKDEG